MHQLMLKDPIPKGPFFKKAFFGATASSMTQIIFFPQRVVSFEMCILKTALVCKKIH